MGRLFRALAVCLLSVLLAACSGIEMKPGDKARNAREIREGPGILTGADGEFVIFRVDEEGTATEDGEWKKVADPEAAETGSDDSTSAR